MDDVPVDEVVVVYDWLRSCTDTSAVAEELAVTVFARAAQPGPVWLAGAPRSAALRFFVVQAVLRRRGVL